MTKQTIYTIKHVTKGRKTLKGKEVKSLNAMHKLLKPGESVTAVWAEYFPSQPKNTFNPWKLGFRQFEVEKDGEMSYSRFPMYEY